MNTFNICKAIESILFILNIENKNTNYNIKRLNYVLLKLISTKNTFKGAFTPTRFFLPIVFSLL